MKVSVTRGTGTHDISDRAVLATQLFLNHFSSSLPPQTEGIHWVPPPRSPPRYKILVNCSPRDLIIARGRLAPQQPSSAERRIRSSNHLARRLLYCLHQITWTFVEKRVGRRILNRGGLLFGGNG